MQFRPLTPVVMPEETAAHIAYYAQPGDSDSFRRAAAILNQLEGRKTLLSTESGFEENKDILPGAELVSLPEEDAAAGDHTSEEGEAIKSGYLSSIATKTPGLRAAQFSHWVLKTSPDLIVVDFSIEVSMLSRVCAVPQLLVRNYGTREDRAYLNACESAYSLLASFPRLLEDPLTTPWIEQKTKYFSGIAPGASSVVTQTQARRRLGLHPEVELIAVFKAPGTEKIQPQKIGSAAMHSEYFDWICIREKGTAETGVKNYSEHEWAKDPALYITAASVVVADASQNIVMQAGARQKPLILLAEDSPFREQERRAAALRREELAVVLDEWPEDSEWDELVERAKALELKVWNKVFYNDGVRECAEYIESVASQFSLNLHG